MLSCWPGLFAFDSNLKDHELEDWGHVPYPTRTPKKGVWTINPLKYHLVLKEALASAGGNEVAPLPASPTSVASLLPRTPQLMDGCR